MNLIIGIMKCVLSDVRMFFFFFGKYVLFCAFVLFFVSTINLISEFEDFLLAYLAVSLEPC